MMIAMCSHTSRTVHSLYGLFFIGFASIGNDTECRSPFIPLIGFFFSIIAVWTPTFVDSTYFLPTVSRGLGCIAAILHLLHIAALVLPQSWLAWNHRLERFVKTRGIMGDVHVKRAAAHKLSVMTRNAIEIAEYKDQDAVLDTHFGQGLHGYARLEQRTERIGGFTWTWKRIFAETLFDEDGIWLSSRLVSNNMTQFVVCVFVVIAGVTLTQTTINDYNKEKAQRLAGEYMGLIFDRTVSEDAVTSVVATLGTYVSEFIGATSAGEAWAQEQCAASNFTSLANDVCSLAAAYYQCEDNATDYLCEIVSGAPADSLLNLALLNSSGLDVDLVLNTTRTALQEAAANSADSIYPAESYM